MLCALRALMSHVTRALCVVVLYMSRVIRDLVPHMSCTLFV